MFLLLAAPSAAAEVTALHMSSGGLPWEPGRAPPQHGDPQLWLLWWPNPPGKQQSRARWGYPVHMAPEEGTQHGAALGQRSGEGAGGPQCGASPICSLHLSPGMASSSCSWHCAGSASNNTPTPWAPTASSLSWCPAKCARGAQSCLSFSQFPSPCAGAARWHRGAVRSLCGVTLHVPLC